MQSTSRYQAYYRLAPVRGWFVQGEPKKIRRTDSSSLQLPVLFTKDKKHLLLTYFCPSCQVSPADEQECFTCFFYVLSEFVRHSQREREVSFCAGTLLAVQAVTQQYATQVGIHSPSLVDVVRAEQAEVAAHTTFLW